MTDYIELEAAKEAVVKAVGKGHSPFNAIVMLPAADVRPVVRGKWQFHMFTANSCGYECLVCHTTWDAPTNFCPNCGADMRKKEET